MPTPLRYRLALDLGSSSIGWCLLRLDRAQKPSAIIRMGVRVFPDGRNPKDGSSLAVTRRAARQMRRRRDRLIKRKYRLLQALVELGFLPTNAAQRKALAKLDPHRLRKEGLDRALTGPEFGRAMFHLNQRRGFLSNRKTDQGSDTGLIKEAISSLWQRIRAENCRTLGEWLANRHARGESVRARLRGVKKSEQAYDFYVDRHMVEAEFDALWAVQSACNPTLFNPAAGERLKGILLYQRPLRPVTPGRCTLLPDEERAPRALPSVQRLRIYQEANNLRIIDSDLTERPPTPHERDKLVALLGRSRKVSFARIRKSLGLASDISFNLEDVKRSELKGDELAAILSHKNRFGRRWHDFDPTQQEQIVERLLEEPNEGVLVRWLQRETGVEEMIAEHIARSSLPQGFGNLSRRAVASVLPHLQNEVIPLSQAVERAGLGSHSALSHLQRTGELFDRLPYYGQALERHVAFGTGKPDDPPEVRYGKIANPTVHIGLNQLRRVVNAIIGRYGPPAEIVVEVARELKQSRERKREAELEQKRNQDRNARFVAQACEILQCDPVQLDRGQRRDIVTKMRLWEELNLRNAADRCCPYTGQPIGLRLLLSEEVEIEHILPFSRTLDDSLNNKTVCMRRANRDKGNRTPWEAFGQEPQSGYDYESILERAALMPKAKARRFARDGYQHWLANEKDFLARALTDTAYISRLAREYLTLICPTPPGAVRVIPGRLTALLRGKFGLNSLLAGSEQKNRNDHRHDAIDAAVIGVTDASLLQRVARASAHARENRLQQLIDEMPLPWLTYRDHVARAVERITVSHRPDHGYQDAMHEAHAWGFNTDGMAVRRERPDHNDRRIRKEHRPDALIPISSTGDPARHGLDEHGAPKAYKGYIGGSNYGIEIWRGENGQWKGDVISTFDAYQLVRQSGAEAGWKRLRHPKKTVSGHPLIMRLMINDMVKLYHDGTWHLARVVNIRAGGKITFAPHAEANVDARDRDRSDPFSYFSKTPSSLRKAKARRVTVNELGDVKDHGFKT